MNSFVITVSSAVSTLQILDKQARKDCGKVSRFTYGVYSVLRSAEAKARYRYAWKKAVQLAEIIGLIAIALVSDLDRWIAAHERVEAVEPVVEVETVETVAPVEDEPKIDSAAILEEVKQVTAPVFKRSRKNHSKSSSVPRQQQAGICGVNDSVPMTEIAM